MPVASRVAVRGGGGRAGGRALKHGSPSNRTNPPRLKGRPSNRPRSLQTGEGGMGGVYGQAVRSGSKRFEAGLKPV